MNESIAIEGRKPKRKGTISTCYTKNGVVHVKKTKRCKARKIYHMYELWGLFPDDVDLEDDEEKKLFHDASQDANNCTQSSYQIMFNY